MWVSVEGEAYARLSEQLGTTDHLQAAKVSFYGAGFLLYQVESREMCVITEDMVFPIGGLGDKILAANEKAKLKITRKNVLEYLMFFCEYCWAEEGPFHIVCDAWVDGFSKPVVLERRGKRFICKALVNYGGNYFLAVFAVEPKTGAVEMLCDEPVDAEKIRRLN